MPLQSGKSKAAFVSNVREMVNTFEKKGTIGNSQPKDKKTAIKQALAIAFAKARKR